MHAALMHLTIDPALAPAAAAVFTNELLPRVRQHRASLPVTGGSVDRQGFGFVLFETEEQTLKATPPATSWSAPGVAIVRVEVRRVAVAIP